MHILSKKNILLENIKIVERAIPLKTLIQSIDGILLEADKNLTFTTNNLEMSIEADDAESQVKQSGRVLLPFRFIDVLKQLPDEDIEIKMEENSYVTEIYSGKAKIFIYGTNADEFPKFTAEEEWSVWNCLEFSAAELRNILKKIIFAVSLEEGNPVFRGVLLELNEKGILSFISSDTYRMARYQIKLTDERKVNQFRLLIPGKSLNELYKIIENSEEIVKCFFSEREMIFIYKHFKISTRLLENNYPDLNHVFPPGFETKITVTRSEFEKMITRASLFAKGNNQMIMLQVHNQNIKIQAGSEMGRIDEDLISEHQEGNDLEEILFNVRYLLDPLRILEEETLQIEFNGDSGPCIFKFEGEISEETENYRYLTLPIKLNK